MSIDYLCIGHCCHDKSDSGYHLGGTASYAAMLARQWRRHPAVLTSFGPDFQFEDAFAKHDIPVFHKPAEQTTTFSNTYSDGHRTQHLLACAATICVDDLSAEMQKSPIVHFGPIADEIHPDLLRAFPNSLKGASIQGFLRNWDHGGRVSPKEMDWSLLRYIDIVVLSKEDIRGVEHFLDKIVAYAPQVVCTNGAGGATVYNDGFPRFFPAYPTTEVDPTGAGDAFTTAYLIDYHRTSDIRSACSFAHCAASFIVESKGTTAPPTLAEVNRRKAVYLKEILK